MAAVQLLVASGLNAVTGLLYFFIGANVARVASPRPARDPLMFFALFWLGLGGAVLSSALWFASLAFAGPNVPVATAILQVKLVSILLAFFGIVYYMAYIFVGSERVLVPLVIAYIAIFAFLEYVIAARLPSGIANGDLGATVTWQNDIGPLWGLGIMGLFLPPLVATVAYGSLLRRVPNHGQRQRIAVVSVAIAAFLFSALGSWFLGADTPWYDVARLFAAVSAAAVFVVISPPSWARVRWGLVPIGAV
ncbi:MAG: hypothetical protein ACYDDF_10660 [Thermoplasmatota archaeon]